MTAAIVFFVYRCRLGWIEVAARFDEWLARRRRIGGAAGKIGNDMVGAPLNTV